LIFILVFVERFFSNKGIRGKFALATDLTDFNNFLVAGSSQVAVKKILKGYLGEKGEVCPSLRGRVQ